MDIYDVARQKIDVIEAELKKLGLWQEEPLNPELLKDMTAFGMNKMTPSQWLQFVFIQRVNDIISSRGNFPPSSDVAVWAVHNFDSEAYQQLIHLLGEFDLLINDRVTRI